MKFKNILFLFTVLLLLFSSCSDGTVIDSMNDNDNGEGSSFSYNHERNPGASALDFLRDDDFENLVVEIQYMEGFRPTNEALSNLESFLEERLHKSSVSVLSPSEVPAGGQESYTANEVRDLEREHRSEFTEENRLAAYFIILDGEYDQSNVLGIAHFNTSMALFGETIRNSTGGIGEPSRSVVETTVMWHEVGHIIGLVDNGIDMQEPHQEHGAHCDVDDCLMYFAVRTTDFLANLLGGNIPELDEFCIADLQAAGGR